MSKLIGTWDLETSEKFDEYMKELGVGFLMRKTGAAMKPTVIIAKDNDTWTIKVNSTFKSSEIVFKDCVEFEESKEASQPNFNGF